MSEKAVGLNKNGKKKPPFSKAVFEQKNAQRIFLIRKNSASGLTPMEAEELECLQNEVGEYINAKWPLPFEYLEHLEASLKKTSDA
jgi:hypothetical protein